MISRPSLRQSWALAIVVVAAAAVIPYLPVAKSYFLQDDFGLIAGLGEKPWYHFVTLFSHSWSENIWGALLDELRPFPALAYQIDYWRAGATPAAYHLTNVLLHAAGALMVFAIARTMARLPVPEATAAGVLFAVWPGHVETVAWITGRCESIMGVAYLATIVTFHRWRVTRRVGWMWLAHGAAIVALFSKQSAVTLVVAVCASELLLRRAPVREILRGTWALMILTGAFLLIRHFAFANVLRLNYLGDHALLAYVRVQTDYLQRLFLPRPWWQVGTVTALVITGLLFLPLLLALWRRARQRAPTTLDELFYWGPVWWLITTAPFVVAGYSTSRFLYVSAAGLAVGCAIGLHRLTSPRLLPAIAFLVLVITCVASTQHELRWWRRAAEQSAALTERLEVRIRTTPEAALVLVDAPREFWVWALPYAFQPPFVPENVFRRTHLVWREGVDCCLGEYWLGRMNSAMSQWQATSAPARVIGWSDQLQDFVVLSEFTHAQFQELLATLPANRTPADLERWLADRFRVRGADGGSGPAR